MNEIDQKGSPDITAQPPKPPVLKRRRWLNPLSFTFMGLGLGILLGMIFTFVLIVLVVTAPLPGNPVPQPATSNKPDANLTLSQEYINREIAAYISANPVKVLNILEIKQVVIELKPGTQVNIAAKAEAFGRQLDLNIKDNVSVSQGKVMLSLAEPVKAGGFDLGFLNLNGAVDSVNVFVAAEINKLIAGVGSALPQHVPNLQKIELGEGFLVATFEVKIGTPPAK